MDRSSAKDPAERIAEIQGRLAAQRVRLFMKPPSTSRGDPRENPKADVKARGFGRTGDKDAGFPRSTTMRLVLEHPEWVSVVLLWLAHRFSGVPAGTGRSVLAVVKSILAMFKEPRNTPSKEARDTDDRSTDAPGSGSTKR